jgi:hypothetical protein
MANATGAVDGHHVGHGGGLTAQADRESSELRWSLSSKRRRSTAWGSCDVMESLAETCRVKGNLSIRDRWDIPRKN